MLVTTWYAPVCMCSLGIMDGRLVSVRWKVVRYCTLSGTSYGATGRPWLNRAPDCD